MIVSETLPASCPCSGAIQFAGRFFAARDARRRTRVAAQPSHSYAVVADANFVSRSRDALELKWSQHDHLPPASFRGSLTVKPAFGGSQLTLAGASTAANAAVLRTAMRSLLRQIVTHVEREWGLFEANCASVAACNGRSIRSFASVAAAQNAAVPLGSPQRV